LVTLSVTVTAASCDAGTTAAGLKNELGANSKPGQHVDERVDAEQVDSTFCM